MDLDDQESYVIPFLPTHQPVLAQHSQLAKQIACYPLFYLTEELTSQCWSSNKLLKYNVDSEPLHKQLTTFNWDYASGKLNVHTRKDVFKFVPDSGNGLSDWIITVVKHLYGTLIKSVYMVPDVFYNQVYTPPYPSTGISSK